MKTIDFEALFRASPYPYLVMDTDLTVLDANKAYLQTTGTTRESIVGRYVFDAFPENSEAPESTHIAEIKDSLEKAIATGKPDTAGFLRYTLQVTHPHNEMDSEKPKPDLERQYWQAIATPIQDRNGKTNLVIQHPAGVTDMYRFNNRDPASNSTTPHGEENPDSARAVYRETEEWLREGMMAAKMVVWDWSTSDRALMFSDNALTVLGAVPDTIDDVNRLLHPDDREKANTAVLGALTNKGEFQETLRLIRPENGDTTWIDVRGKIRTDKTGAPYAMRGVALDVTDRVRANETLSLAGHQKDEFLAMLAHELRNPLAPISSAAHLLTLTQPDQAQLERTGEIIKRQIKHMVGLVDDLLDVSRVTRGRIATDMEMVDLKPVVTEAIEQSSPLIQSRMHQLNVNLTDEDARIVGDHKRMVQVLTNLLNNAAKYTPAGGVITLDLAVNADTVLLNVTDNGIGITPELLPRVFDLFTQAERSADRSEGGLGIGLALAKSLIEIHGGSISVASDPDSEGSRFEIELPRVDAPMVHNQSPDKKATGSLRILVVDDNEDAANTLAQVLETLGHRASVEYTARGAIERAVGETQDIFLLDIGLPEMDGNALVRYLRAQPDTANALMIAITGYGAEENRREALAAGFDEYLVKPVDLPSLERLITGFRPQ